MNDESRLGRALTEQLRRRADEADPPSGAWQRFSVARSARTDGSSGGVGADDPPTEITLIEEHPPTRSKAMNRKWLLSGVAAAAALILVVWAVAAGGDDDEGSRAGTQDDGVVPSVTATAPPATPATDPPPPVVTPTEAALATVDGLFAAYDAGDMDSVMAAMSADAVFDEAADEPGNQFATRDEFEILWTWDVAQGTDKVDRDCSATEGGVVVVTCTFSDHQYLQRAVGAPPVPNTLLATVDGEAITSIAVQFGQPDYLPTGVPFEEWAALARPDVADLVGCCGGDSVAEAEQRGETRRQLADEWAAHLEANGCTYDVSCPVADAVAVVNGVFAAYDAGDIEGVMAAFAPDATVIYPFGDSTLGEFEILWTWDVAQGTDKLSLDCRGEEDGNDVIVSCTYDDHQHLSQVVGGPPVPNFFTATVNSDTIVALDHLFGQPDYNTVSVAYDAWLDQTHPEDGDIPRCCGGDSVVEAQQRGELRMQRADEWAAHLDREGCTYDAPC